MPCRLTYNFLSYPPHSVSGDLVHSAAVASLCLFLSVSPQKKNEH